MLGGESAVGKSTLLKSFLKGYFVNESYSNFPYGFLSKKCLVENENNIDIPKEIKFIFTDCTSSITYE